jgi:hypothetical protein
MNVTTARLPGHEPDAFRSRIESQPLTARERFRSLRVPPQTTLIDNVTPRFTAEALNPGGCDTGPAGSYTVPW